MSWSTRERVGTDSDGNPKYRTRTTTWAARVPVLRVELRVRGEDGATSWALWLRRGDAHATGHHSHYVVQPDDLELAGGFERLHGELDADLVLVM